MSATSGVRITSENERGQQSAWGHSFQWSKHHKTYKQYSALKQSFDVLAEESLPLLESRVESGNGNGDLYQCLAKHHSQEPTLTRLWHEVTTVPDWVDWDQIARGQEVFYRYGLATLVGLAYSGLLGGTGGSGKIAETLSKTGGFSLKVARNRLLETTQFVLQVTESPSSIKPGGAGFAAALRVRLLHARVRRRIVQLAAARPGYYSVEDNGVPINDADCISTIAAFSSMVIWQALPRQGIQLRKQEIADYVALWRLVALYMGTPTDAFATPAAAKAALETALLYEYDPTPTSRALARNIVRALENEPPAYASRSFVEANARWLNGDALSDAMGLARPPLYYWLLVAGQVAIFAAFYRLVREIPALDRMHTASMRRVLWEVVTDARQGGLKRLSVFDFKYVPGLERRFRAEDDIAEKQTPVFWTADRKAVGIVVLPAVGIVLWLWVLVHFGRMIAI